MLQGFLNGLTLGFGWQNSAQETISQISGERMSGVDETLNAVGKAAGFATTTAAGVLAAPAVCTAVAGLVAASPITALVAGAFGVGALAYCLYKHCSNNNSQ